MRIGRTMIMAAALLTPSALAAQFPPERVENLQVLPEDLTVREVMNWMRGFSMSLGVRCQYCHVGEAGRPLSEFDFVSDEKPEKEKARTMLRMMEAINGSHLADLPDRSDPPIQVTCATCHHGVAKPQTIQAILSNTIRNDGVEAAVAEYRGLRDQYYGSYSYDFSEMALVLLANDVENDPGPEAAMAILELNLEFNPNSAITLLGLGQLAAQTGDTDAAIGYLERSLEIAPQNPQARRLLDRLRNR